MWGTPVKKGRKASGGFSRRDFLKAGAVAGAAALATRLKGNLVFAAGADKIRVGVIGCGKRGAQAAQDCVKSSTGVEVTALADVFPDRVNALKAACKVKDDHCFVGLDAYKALLASPDVDLVVLATPQAFRPVHVTEAIAKGKHVLMEAPVAVCPAGIKMVIEASNAAKEKKLAVGGGFQKRHDPAYVETVKRLRDGAIGKLLTAQCYTNQGCPEVYKKKDNESDVEWQLRNWRFFIWLSGDHIVDAHAQRLDVVNWALNAQPDNIHSLGSRQSRSAPEYGNTYDHFGTEFFYPGDISVISMCRNIEGTEERIGEHLVGAKGSTDCCGTIKGETAWKYDGPKADPYVQEFTDLIKSIRDGAPLNEGQAAADSTLSAIMARESGYMRQQFRRQFFTSKCTQSLLPPEGLKLSDAKPMDAIPDPNRYKFPGFPEEQPKKRK
jgi:predicted dehydrogenase